MKNFKHFIFVLLLFFNLSKGPAQIKRAMFDSSAAASKLFVPIYHLSNTERYKKDYEVKGWSYIQDSTKINQLDLEHYDSLRDLTQDKEILDPLTGLMIIVYSKNKTTANKQ